MFDFLNSTLQLIQKVSLLNNKVNYKKYLHGPNIDHKYISVREYIVYNILLFTISTDSCKYLKYFNLQNKICTYR